jgi:hypothetical protein
MGPQPPPLDGWQPSLPPPYDTPPPPPAWPASTVPEAASQTQTVRWIIGAGTMLALVALVIVAFVGWHPPGSALRAAVRQTARPTTSAIAPSVAIPSATPVSAAVAEAGQQYLAAVAPVNADGARFDAALDADASLPCTCSPGEFAIRQDTIDVIPSIDNDTEALQVVLQTIKHDVPAIGADIDAVVLDNQEYTDDLAAAYRASQITNGAIGAYIDEAQAVYAADRSDFARLRSDLGLPPPPVS